eukprot:gene12932-14171_t
MEDLKDFEDQQMSSFDSMDGSPDYSAFDIRTIEVDTVSKKMESLTKTQCCKCITFTCLISALNHIFRETDPNDWPTRRELIQDVLKNTYLDEKEFLKYVFVDTDIPYTRNLVFSDGRNFSLILICWNPNKESKIHDHPCDGCFVKTLRGGVKESRYHMEEVEENGEKTKVMKFDFETVTSANEVNYMDNYLGYHKIGCATEELAITLHLYTPPFKTCRVWPNPADCKQEVEVKMVYYSELGVRTPEPDEKK